MSSQRPHENRRETRRSLGYKMARQPGGEASPKRNSSLNLVTGFFHYLRGEWDALSAWLWEILRESREESDAVRASVCVLRMMRVVFCGCVCEIVWALQHGPYVLAARVCVCVCAFCSAVFKCSLLGRFCIHFYKCFPGLWCILKANVLTFIGGRGGAFPPCQSVCLCVSPAELWAYGRWNKQL